MLFRTSIFAKIPSRFFFSRTSCTYWLNLYALTVHIFLSCVFCCLIRTINYHFNNISKRSLTFLFPKPTKNPVLVHLVLHPHGIAPTFLKLDSWSPGAGFIPIISTKGINQKKKGILLEKKLSFMHTKKFIKNI